MIDISSSSNSSSLFRLTTKLTQTKTANKSNGWKIGNSDKTIYTTEALQNIKKVSRDPDINFPGNEKF